MNKQKWKDLAERAAWTFAEAFLATLTFEVSDFIDGVRAWRAVLLSALAAGLSAVKTAVLAELQKKKEVLDHAETSGDD